MNYGEELAYWYLRFNGFFPITNFVIHRDESDIFLSESERAASDCDVLAIRTPYVFENIGGQQKDWDAYLTEKLNFNLTLGIICEVKTGEYNAVLQEKHIDAGVDRLGFFPQSSDYAFEAKHRLLSRSTYEHQDFQIAKLLIADTQQRGKHPYFFISLNHTRDFIRGRVREYKQRKYGERHFFQSSLIQEIFCEVKRERS